MWPLRCHAPPPLDEHNNTGQAMARREGGDGEDRDPLAGGTGPFVIYLFGRDGDERGNITR